MTDALSGRSPVSLEAVLCTEELHRRPARLPDYETENRLLRALTQALADSPLTILQTLAEKILEGLGADSAGVSLLAEDNKSFFWPAIAGAWAPHVGGGTPRDFGPCGDVLDRNIPLLFTHFERRYSYFLPATPPAEECLLVPFYIEGKAVGTIWAIAHDGRRKFDAEDLRQLESLGAFASAAYQAETKTATEQRRAARELAEAVQAGQTMEALHAKLLASHDALRRSEGDLRDFVDNAALALHWVGADGSILWANQTELDLLGYTRDEYFGQHIADFHADEPVIADILARLTGGETLRDYEARLRCRDGSIRHVLINSNALFENGQFVHTRCFTRDITERKQAENLLQHNHDTFFNLIQNSPFGLYVVDAQLRMRQVSTASEKVFRNVRPLIGRDFEDIMRTLWPDAFVNDVIGRFRHTLETGEAYAMPDFTEQRRDITDVESYDWKIERITLPDGQFGVVCYFYDITERRLAEDALRESEAFNRSIVESSPDCIKVLGLDGTLLSLLSGQELLGIEDEKPFLNTSWFDLWEGEHRRAAQSAVAVAAAGGAGSFVGFFRTFRGEPKWWDVAISPILDAGGKPARLLAVSRDVTQRTRGELNLEFLASVSHDLLHLTSVDDMLQTVGAKLGAFLDLSLCAFVDINETADEVEIFHDWRRADVPGLVGVYPLSEFVEPEFIRAARAGNIIVVRDTVTDPRTEPTKFTALKIASFICAPLIRDGQWRFALCLYHSAAYDWREDEIELAREVTARIGTRLERLRSEEALRISEERYHYLFNSIDEGFCVIEMIFDEQEQPVDYRFLEVNPSFEKQSGLHDAAGKRMREFAPDMESSWFTRYGDVALTGEPVRFINESKTFDSWFDVYAFRIGGPESRKVAVIFNNITERTKVEQALRESAEALADLDHRKDEFLAMLGHELRNPLAPLSYAVHMLGLQTKEDPLQRQARQIIERQVSQLKHLVDDLLEISRVTTGRLQLRQERIAVSGIVERAVETAQPLITQRRHELTVSLPLRPIWLHADAARMEQVVVNLLTNAAKYTDEGGHIWLTVQQEGDEIVLRVRDTGVGIASEFLPRIFDLFTQAERSLDRSEGGLGIGLCLVKRLVDLHGGTVEAHSVLGQGSEFVVRMPVMRSTLSVFPLDVIESALPRAKRCRVLIVDDNADAAQSLALLLTASGHDVRMAHDGPTAVEAALDYRPDLALMDIGLPGFDGYEVAQRMRQQPVLQHALLVAMTGYGQEKDRLRSLAAGFDHHLVKPVNFESVQEILALVSAKAS